MPFNRSIPTRWNFSRRSRRRFRAVSFRAYSKKKDFTRYKRFVFNHLKVNKISSPDFMSFAGKDLPNKYVTGSGLPVFAWTVRSNSDMEKVLPHCDNFIFENFIPVNDENNRI